MLHLGWPRSKPAQVGGRDFLGWQHLRSAQTGPDLGWWRPGERQKSEPKGTLDKHCERVRAYSSVTYKFGLRRWESPKELAAESGAPRL